MQLTDATIIIEQIAPMFRPDITLKIQELDIQKAILAENATNANSVFQALSKSSQIEKDSPAGVPDPKGTSEGSPLKKFLDPEGHGSLEDEGFTITYIPSDMINGEEND